MSEIVPAAAKQSTEQSEISFIMFSSKQDYVRDW